MVFAPDGASFTVRTFSPPALARHKSRHADNCKLIHYNEPSMTRWHKMTRSWLSHHALGVLLLWALSSCSTLPSKYVEQAEPGVTLTALTTSPQQFRDKVVILDGPEAGHFWVTAANRDQLTARYRKWARMTIVGHVIGATESEPG